MNDQTTLRDYVRLLRRYRLTIAVSVGLGLVLAAGISLQQSTVFAAKASLTLEDENRDLGLLGTFVAPSSTPEQRAARGAETVVRPDVLAQAKDRLRLKRSIASLATDVQASPEPNSNLVVIEARDADAKTAAALANTVAQVAVDEQARIARAKFTAAADQLQKRLRQTNRNDPSRVVFAERVSQLEALAAVARPANIAARATVPRSPVAPRPVRNIAIGGFLGLLLGLAAAATRSSLDQRVKGSHDLREVLNLPIVGNVPNELMGQVGFGINGAKTTTSPDLEPFRILRTNMELLSGDKEMRSVAVTSPLSGEGKSTVSASLAIAFAFAGRRTLLLECDLRRPVLAKRMGQSAVPGLADYLKGDAQPQDVLRTVALTGGGNGRADAVTPNGPALACIFAGDVPDYPAELLQSPRFASLLAELTVAYDVVVIDTSPLLLVSDTLEILPLTDGVVLCARTSQTTRDQAVAAQEVLEHLPPKPTGVVLTGVNPSDDGLHGYYGYKRYGYS